MKKILVISILALLSVFAYIKVNSQSPVTQDSVNATALYIHPTSNPSATFYLLGTFNELTSVFGSPMRTGSSSSSTYGGNVTHYSFQDFTISFVEGKSIGERIHGPSVSLGITGKGSIKVGDNISKLQGIFPNSYALRKDDMISVAIFTPSGEASDSFLTFHFDNNNVITNIWTN